MRYRNETMIDGINARMRRLLNAPIAAGRPNARIVSSPPPIPTEAEMLRIFAIGAGIIPSGVDRWLDLHEGEA